MLRTVWTALVAVIVTIPCALSVITLSAFSTSNRGIDAVIRFWARSIAQAAGIELHGERLDTLDPARRYILVANHYSYFDIPCILAAVPQPIRFMAKVSLFKIPVFGWAMARAGFIPIDRKDRRKAVKSFDQAGQRIRKGNTIVVFPEEGRSHERTMRPFQRGAFLLAIRSGLPILPIAVDGTFDVMCVGAKRVTPGKVTVKAGRPIATEGISVHEKEKLAEEARAQIEAMLFGEADRHAADDGTHPS